VRPRLPVLCEQHLLMKALRPLQLHELEGQGILGVPS